MNRLVKLVSGKEEFVGVGRGHSDYTQEVIQKTVYEMSVRDNKVYEVSEVSSNRLSSSIRLSSRPEIEKL